MSENMPPNQSESWNTMSHLESSRARRGVERLKSTASAIGVGLGLGVFAVGAVVGAYTLGDRAGDMIADHSDQPKTEQEAAIDQAAPDNLATSHDNVATTAGGEVTPIQVPKVPEMPTVGHSADELKASIADREGVYDGSGVEYWSNYIDAQPTVEQVNAVLADAFDDIGITVEPVNSRYEGEAEFRAKPIAIDTMRTASKQLLRQMAWLPPGFVKASGVTNLRLQSGVTHNATDEPGVFNNASGGSYDITHKQVAFDIESLTNQRVSRELVAHEFAHGFEGFADPTGKADTELLSYLPDRVVFKDAKTRTQDEIDYYAANPTFASLDGGNTPHELKAGIIGKLFNGDLIVPGDPRENTTLHALQKLMIQRLEFVSPGITKLFELSRLYGNKQLYPDQIRNWDVSPLDANDVVNRLAGMQPEGDIVVPIEFDGVKGKVIGEHNKVNDEYVFSIATPGHEYVDNDDELRDVSKQVFGQIKDYLPSHKNYAAGYLQYPIERSKDTQAIVVYIRP